MTKLFNIRVTVESDNDLSEVNLGTALDYFTDIAKVELERQLSVNLCHPEVVEDTEAYTALGMRDADLTTFTSIELITE